MKKLALTFAIVYPAELKRTTRSPKDSHYANSAEWVTLYAKMTIEERELFHGAVAEAINTEGLTAPVLYQDDSAPFIKDHKDNGAPAVSLKDSATCIAESFKTVESAVNAFRNSEFIQAWQDGIEGSIHGLHMSLALGNNSNA